MKNPIEKDDLGVPPFKETSSCSGCILECKWHLIGLVASYSQPESSNSGSSGYIVQYMG